MKHILVAVTVLLSLSQMAHGDSSPPPTTDRGQLFVTFKGNFLELILEVPASAAILKDSKTPSVANQIEYLQGTLKYTYGIFRFPSEAECYRKHIDVMESEKPGVIASWQFDCKNPLNLDRIGTELFSLVNLHSIETVMLPDNQWTLRPDDPLIKIKPK